MTYTAIVKILTTIEQAAQECLNNFGEGAHPDSEQVEAFFSYNNTPLQSGYCRIVVASYIATALQWMQDNSVASDNVEIIRVEWDGQDMYADVDGDGNSILVERLFETGMSEPVTLEDGTIIPATPVYLGRIG